MFFSPPVIYPKEVPVSTLGVPPGDLTNSSRLAQQVYEYWTTTMHTDKVPTLFPEKFDKLSMEERVNLVEAFKIVITGPLRKYLSDLEEKVKKVDDIAKKVAPTIVKKEEKRVGYPCYCCAKHAVVSPGGVCWSCAPRKKDG